MSSVSGGHGQRVQGWAHDQNENSFREMEVFERSGPVV
jgi:hypothetical protein